MLKYRHIKLPAIGQKIEIDGDNLIVKDHPIIPFIEGEGIGPDVWKATKTVIDNAVKLAYEGKKKIAWMEVFAGEKALKLYGKNQWLPKETLEALKEYSVAIKGPLATPVSKGIKSLNVTLREELDLFACIRPVKYYPGTPTPINRPEDLDVVIFRENTEDVYTGIEYKANSKEAREFIDLIGRISKKRINENTGLGIKHISEFSTIRLVKKAIEYALENKRKSVTLVHKGNIMKFTEGAFRDWGYKAAKMFFPNVTITEQELTKKYRGKIPPGKILINDRIMDNMFQQLMLRPADYDVIATSNLNGDYLSDASAAMVGGLGIAPGANMSYSIGLFEASHGTAPKYAGKDIANPSALILSGALMLNYLGWTEAADKIEKALKFTIESKVVTNDFAARKSGAKVVKCSRYAKEIVKNMS